MHFRKSLDGPPAELDVAGVAVRAMRLPEDLAAWLQLRRRAVAWLAPAVREWTADDFAAEMSGKRWWRHAWTWLAVAEDEPQQIIGSVTLAIREGSAGAVPVVHWLLVDPRWRRRGVARKLMAHLERSAWDEGWREVQLETHAGWKAAVAFYQSIGFEPV
jgi:GNAT superfamily N-acetyltransferase